MRYSHQRELILAAVKGANTHPTADAVYDGLKADNPTLSLGTVYRNLNILAENGDINTLYTGSGKIHYDGHTEAHAHFVCKNCKKIIDIFCEAPTPCALPESEEFCVEEQKTIYYGKCKACADAQS
ncbi:MAG: Fur family transcriptional regulator [Eubacteriales bacterium]